MMTKYLRIEGLTYQENNLELLCPYKEDDKEVINTIVEQVKNGTTQGDEIEYDETLMSEDLEHSIHQMITEFMRITRLSFIELTTVELLCE